MIGSRLLLGFAFALGFSACVSSVENAPLPKRQPLVDEFEAYAAPSDVLTGTASPPQASTPKLVRAPEEILTLRESLSLALQHNPELAAFSWDIRVREADALQAGLLPNPEIEVELENFAGSGDARGFGGSENTLALGQLIELGGKRLKRRRVAELERDLASWDYEIHRIEVFTEVALAFVAVKAAQERLALSYDLLGIAEEALTSVAKQVAAGAASPVERFRAEVVVSTTRVDQRTNQAELVAARSRLAATWGSTQPVMGRVEGDFYAVQPLPSFKALRALVEETPDLARWHQEIELREAVVGLEDARRIPDVTAAAGVRRLYDSGDTALIFGLSVPLPLFDRNQGARQAARRELSKARHQRRAAVVRAGTALNVAFQLLEASFVEVTALRDDLLPRAGKAYQGVRGGYLRGLFRYVDVLDAQRTLFELRGRQVGALESYHSAVATIERLTGASLASAPKP